MREGTSEGWAPAIISTMGSPAQAGRVHECTCTLNTIRRRMFLCRTGAPW